MSLGLSALNGQRYDYNLIDNSICLRCGSECEDVIHYFMDCPRYAVPRIKLLEELSCLLQPSGVDVYADKQVTTNIILNGSNDLNTNHNLNIYKIAEEFIQMSNRF